MVDVSKYNKIISSKTLVYLDANVFIYHFDEVKKYSKLCRKLFSALDTGKCRGLSATLTLTELNVKAYEMGLDLLASQITALLHANRYFSFQDLTADIANKAALIRAKFKFKTPDSIHLATALSTECKYFITNDKQLNKINHILPIVQLDNLL